MNKFCNSCQNNNLNYDTFIENLKVGYIWNSLIFDLYKNQIEINTVEIENELEQIEEIPYFRMMGDSAINVYLGTQISPEINDKVHFLSNLIDEKNWTGVIEVVPSYISITIHYDPFVIDYLSIKGFVENVLD